ncbi:MAG: phosphoglucosamine mutase [Actinobacteria bacterium]|nr:phosphoglucosamine mutase [Actinomycetota bacterium]
MTPRFGTDGIRGVAGVDLTPELVLALGRAAVRVLGRSMPYLVARDTRRSGPMLEAALTAGICVEGGDVESYSVLPTPGLANVCRRHGAPGVMISASHNPFPDNGVKLFAPGGRKLTDAQEAEVADALEAVLAQGGAARSGVELGEATRAPVPTAAYVNHLVDAVAPGALNGLSVVLDCGHGAAFRAAPEALRRLGAEVTVCNDAPDGTNINAGCGSTDPTGLAATVVELGAHAGVAFDGDADRVIAVDERGSVVDGDHMLAVMAIDMRERGVLRGDAVVTTVMANLGLRRALAAHDIVVVETPVGDRHVLAAMEAGDYRLGGEQSGHVIFADHASTGDGPLTSVLLLDALARARRPLSELAAVVVKYPQVLRNVRVGDRSGLDAAERFWAEVRAVEAELGDDGRVLVRPSGTEPVVRVMVEAGDPIRAVAMVDRLEAVLLSALSR